MNDPQNTEIDSAWLASADAASLDSELDRASAAIRELSAQNIEAAAAGVANVLRRTLENGSRLDPLPPATAKPLVLASLAFLRRNAVAVGLLDDGGGLASILARLDQRRADFANPAIDKALDQLKSQFEMSDANPPRQEAAAVAASGAAAGEAAVERMNPLDEWMAKRRTLDAAGRAAGDVRVLAAHVGRLIPTSFAEAMYEDDEVWAEVVLAEWLDQRAEPFDATKEGVASAALLNARVREVRPRFFLRSPSSLVVQPIVNATEVEEMRIEIRNDFVIRALTSVFDARAVLEAERARGAKATVRKNEVLKVSDTLKALFVRLGYDERPQVGTMVEFDPVDHQGPADAHSQELMVVVRAGLWDSAARRFIIRPVTARRPDQPIVESGDNK